METALIVAFFELTGILLSLTAPQITPSGEKNTPYPMRGESISCPILIRPYVSHPLGLTSGVRAGAKAPQTPRAAPRCRGDWQVAPEYPSGGRNWRHSCRRYTRVPPLSTL